MKLPPWLARLRNQPLRLLANMLVRLVGVLPSQTAYKLGAWLAAAAYAALPAWRRTARRNLELLYQHSPDWAKPDEEEMAAIGHASARHLGWGMIEFIRLGLLPPRQGLAMVAEVAGIANLRAAEAQGKGVLMISLHFGNWELAGAYIATNLLPLYAVGKEQRDPFFTRLAFGWRAKYGMKVIPSGRRQGSGILRALRENAGLGLISDQNGGRDGTFAPFCGIPASTVTGAAVLALKTGAPIVLVYTRRLAPGKHRWYCSAPLDQSGLPEDPSAAQLELLTRINRCIESIVRSDPAQWLLGHKRWRTRPTGEPPLYR